MRFNFFQLQKMSLKIIKAGILDTIQDGGRTGFQSSGINPGGAMDRFSAQLANCLLGKEMKAVIEIHFPASIILFEIATIICITGANFSPLLNNISIPINQPVVVNRNSILEFRKVQFGARCYLSILQNLSLPKWLNSFSTNLRANAGGYEGRALQKGDVIQYTENEIISHFLGAKNVKVLPFKSKPFHKTTITRIEIIAGKEWDSLTEESRHLLETKPFKISKVADRMGYRLQGESLQLKEQKQIVSSAVSFGTLQLLPNGQLIVLMADHQTTGGYPRVGHVISAHLPLLAQMKPYNEFTFTMVNIETAEQKLLEQHKYLLSVRWASAFKIEKILQ